MSAKNIKKIALIGLPIALVLAVIFKDKILIIAGAYWGLIVLLTILLKIVSPEEYQNLKSDSDNADDEVPGLESDEDTDVLRKSFLEGKYSLPILIISFVAVMIGGFIFIVFTGIDYNEHQAYIANESVFNRDFVDFIIFQIAPVVIAAALTAIGCVNIYELLTGVVTPQERKENRISLVKNFLLVLVPIAVSATLVFTIQNWVTIITEEGIEFHRPYKSTAYCQWEDMVSFTYDEGSVFSGPEADIKFRDGTELNIDFGDFYRESDKFYDKYGNQYENGKRVPAYIVFADHIFCEKYEHLNSMKD